MAHKVNILQECDANCWCGACYEVFNAKNMSQGKFCKRHADKRVRDLQKSEDAERAAKRKLDAETNMSRAVPRRG